MASSVSVKLPSYGYTYTFTGVLSIKHEYSLKLQTDSDSAAGEDYINGARNQPDKVILSVVETDIGHMEGWADRMLQAMESVKRTRTLCSVVTSARTYTNMLLSDLTVTVDENSPSGWKGTLTFTQYVRSSSSAKTSNKSSTTTHTGSTATVRTVSSQSGSSGTSSPLQQMLERAGVSL